MKLYSIYMKYEFCTESKKGGYFNMSIYENSLSILGAAVSSGAAPCIAAAIGVKDQPPVIRIYGNASLFPDPTPANIDTRFDLASMTKIVATSMVALRLIELGEISLKHTIGNFFSCPDFRQSVSIQQLMTHTGGFIPYLNLQELAPSAGQALQIILQSAPVCNPGQQVFYSCMGYIVLGSILEKVTGTGLDQLARQLVFDPLHMTHTDYCPKGSNFAATEKWGNGYLSGIVHDENARFLGGISGNAGVFSDLNDMICFASMLACHGQICGRQFLQEDTLNQAVRCYTEHKDQRRGLGFHLASPGSFHGAAVSPGCFGHTGFTGTSLIVEPDTGLYVVLLSNRVHPTRENQRFGEIRREFHTSVLHERWQGNLENVCV